MLDILTAVHLPGFVMTRRGKLDQRRASNNRTTGEAHDLGKLLDVHIKLEAWETMLASGSRPSKVQSQHLGLYL
jgi:hypothetical protein